MRLIGEEASSITRRTVLAAAASLVLGACARGGESSPDQQPQEEPKPPTVIVRDHVGEPQRSQFARMMDEGSVSSIRLIGDSITAGFLCDGYGPTTDVMVYDGPYGTFWESSHEVDCYANRFRAYAEEHGVKTFVNAGINGAKMRWLAEDADAWIRESADVIFVMLGTNDAVYHTEDEFRSSAEAGLAAVAKSCSHMVVLAPPDNGWTDYSKVMFQDSVERALKETCDQYGWEFASTYASIKTGTDDFNEDQCHPTSKGSAAIWDCIARELGLTQE